MSPCSFVQPPCSPGRLSKDRTIPGCCYGVGAHGKPKGFFCKMRWSHRCAASLTGQLCHLFQSVPTSALHRCPHVLC